MSRSFWAGLLWPQPAKHPAARRSVLAVIRVRAGRVHFAWALPLFVVEDLVEGAAFYAGWMGPWGRRMSAGLLPAWRQLRWAGPMRLVDVRVADVIFALRLV